MIRRQPITSSNEPNFRCTLEDADGKTSVRLTRGLSEEDVRVRLSTNGCQVTEAQPFDFSEWRGRAAGGAGAGAAAAKRGQPPDLDRRIWSELKSYLFEIFDGKCAYCESKVLDVAAGDVEHYRPKKGVDGMPTHPGYYWLAYDLENLLPCCEKCNRAGAKMNLFPIPMEGDRAWRPEDDIEAEHPYLLNPYGHDPAEHLRFVLGPDGRPLGTVAGTTEAGRKSVEIYHLNRPELIEERRSEQQCVVLELELLLGRDRDGLSTFMKDRCTKARKYSAAAVAQVDAWRAMVLAEVQRLGTA